ncbi:MAG TPA: hypothetical protein VK176_04155, partial [Phycisphaerales bacterium]|nr:hypothetical protein [Phycisphaerales bacterium]
MNNTHQPLSRRCARPGRAALAAMLLICAGLLLAGGIWLAVRTAPRQAADADASFTFNHSIFPPQLHTNK